MTTQTLSILETLKNPALYRKAYLAFFIPLLGAIGLALADGNGLTKEEISAALAVAIAAFVGTFSVGNAEPKVSEEL